MNEEIKTTDVVISEYEKRLTRFIEKLKVLRRRNRTLSRLIYLKAYSSGALEYPEMLQKNSAQEYQPKRGKKQYTTFPIKMVQEALKCSHRQAMVYHLAGLLEEEAWSLSELHGKEALEWKAQQEGKPSE